MNEKELAKANTIYTCYAGSRMYGTNLVDSDYDIRSISILPMPFYIGLRSFEQLEEKNVGPNEDLVIHDIKKYIKLAMMCNPNIIEYLYCAEPQIKSMNEFGSRLRSFRSNFLSKEVYHRFGGYAYSQMRKLLYKEPEGNRKEIIDKYGFDVKHASHCLRLMYEGVEMLNDQHLTLPCPQRKELLDVRMGRITYEGVIARYGELRTQLDMAYINTKLPKHPDFNLIDEFLQELLMDYWNR